MSEILDLLKKSEMTYYYSFSSAAARLNMGIGRNTIYAILQEKGLIDKNRKPNQDLVDAGYLQYEKARKYLGNTYQYIMVDSLKISNAGIIWLEQILKEHHSGNIA